MEEQLISFETAKLAKEKGFIGYPSSIAYKKDGSKVTTYEECATTNEDGIEGLESLFEKGTICIANPQSVLQKWLREVHNIEVLISIFPKQMRERMNKEKYCGYILNEDWNPTIPSTGTFCKTYEEAIEAGLQEALKLIK